MHSAAQQKLLRRLSIIEGQLRGVRKMVEEERYCVDVITQTEAVKNALSGVENALMERHLSMHVVEQMKKGQEGKATAEILKIYKLAQWKR
jgi:DNA-binding FrmR family transcriptional regulator